MRKGKCVVPGPSGVVGWDLCTGTAPGAIHVPEWDQHRAVPSSCCVAAAALTQGRSWLTRSAVKWSPEASVFHELLSQSSWVWYGFSPCQEFYLINPL